MFKQRKLSQKLYARFGIMIGLTAVMSISPLISLKKEHALSSIMRQSEEELINIEMAVTLQAELRESRLTASPAEKQALIQHWQSTVANITSEMQTLQNTKGLPPESQELTEQIISHTETYQQLFADFSETLNQLDEIANGWKNIGTQMSATNEEIADQILQTIQQTDSTEKYTEHKALHASYSSFLMNQHHQRVAAIYTITTPKRENVKILREHMTEARKLGKEFVQSASAYPKLKPTIYKALKLNTEYQKFANLYLKQNNKYLNNHTHTKENNEALLQKLHTFTNLVEAQKDKLEKATTYTISSLFIVLMVLGFLFAFSSVRSIVRPLHSIISQLTDGSNQLQNASKEVSSASQALAEGATEQAAGLEESSASLEEVTGMTRKNADHASQAHTLASEARNHANIGTEAMGRMGGAINDIKQSANETAKIIKVIDDIAFQTNLLALNASVEAARAGEAGKGFAVVAEEVRNLAMRSAEAARNTANLIQESVNKAQNGVDIASQVDSVLNQIVESIGKTNDLVSEIAEASQEQAHGIDQISTAIAEMDGITQQNAASAEESASASGEMNTLSVQIGQIVQELQSLIQGGATPNLADQPAETDPCSDHELSSMMPPESMDPEMDPHFDIAQFEHPNPKAILSPEEEIPFDEDLADFNT